MKRAQQNVDVYDPSFSSVLNIPRDAIAHMPPSSLNISRLVLCRNYGETGHCPKAHSCKFVHADISGKSITRTAIHVNYAWRSAEVCEYKRLDAGKTLKVFAPNNRAPAELIPSDRVLVTRGAQTALETPNSATPVSHCAHYHFNRICNRGEKCSFVHAIYVDPNAEHLQKAPAPSMSRQHQFPLADEETQSDDISSVESKPSDELETSVQEVDEPIVIYKYRHDPYSFHQCHVVLVENYA